MSYSIQSATVADLSEMTEIMVAASADDCVWKGMMGKWTLEQEYEFTHYILRSTMTSGFLAGSYKCWKVIDESGLVSLFFIHILPH